MTKELKWNVRSNEEFKEIADAVFKQVAGALLNSIGPYGSTTIIEQFGETYITKDGWNILKRIKFDNQIEQNVLNLIERISAQVVIKVGDGSTSAVVGSQFLYDCFTSYITENESHNIRPKDLMEMISKAVEIICEEILKNAKKIDITTEEGLDDIYKLALISTNTDKTISNIIREIYKETQNPHIEFYKSKDSRTHYEIIEGYQLNATYIDSIFTTNDEGLCEINKPLILMFDHKIDETHYNNIIRGALEISAEKKRRLVVLAPYFDAILLKKIQGRIEHAVRNFALSPDVYCKVSLVNSNLQEEYNDFSIMTGGKIIRESDLEGFLSDELRGDAPKLNVADFIGEVDYASIGIQKSIFKGFESLNKPLYEIALRDAKAKYKKLLQTHQENSIVDSKLYEVKKRIAKLTCKVGIIHVGGYSNIEKRANFDLVEDAVKACESAFTHGYNNGCNLSIIKAALENISCVEDKEKLASLITYNDFDNFDIEDKILACIASAFMGTYFTILYHKFVDDKKCDEICLESIKLGKCYNLITDKFDDDVINPCYTDIEILRASASIIGLLINSNQYISIQPDNEL